MHARTCLHELYCNELSRQQLQWGQNLLYCTLSSTKEENTNADPKLELCWDIAHWLIGN